MTTSFIIAQQFVDVDLWEFAFQHLQVNVGIASQHHHNFVA